MDKTIIFTNTMDVPEEFAPKPATSFVPDWYKDLESYTGGEKKPTGEGQTTGTLKRCMPVFDAITQGYIITTYVDIYVSQKPIEYVDKRHFDKTGETIILDKRAIKKKNLLPTTPWYEWPSFGPIQFHPIEQAPTHPAKNGAPYPKFINPWGIKTPPGYSTMFMAPVHRENLFTIMPGVVDTDTYTAPVNFPGVLTNVAFEGLIPAGTPIAQVIPFQRESWTMELGEQEARIEINKVASKLRTRFFDSYKTQYRQVKEYK
jgi:hypothetical protein